MKSSWVASRITGYGLKGGTVLRRDLDQNKMPSMASSSPSAVNHSSVVVSDEEWGSLRMKRVAEQLRVYRAPCDNGSTEEEEEEGDEGPGEIASSVGVPESKAIPVAPPMKKAAVLICLFEGPEGELRVILTRRASSLASHSGEVALPGGKRDEGDVDDAATALREAHEEIGLEPSSVKVVASLEAFLSKHLFRVIPVIGILPNKLKLKLKCNEAEVESVFDAPLEMFLKNESHRSEQHQWLGSDYKLHYYDYEYHGHRYLIWGLTAAILIRAASIIYQRPPEFEEFSPDFRSIKKKFLLRMMQLSK